jgi:hypothetical protein
VSAGCSCQRRCVRACVRSGGRAGQGCSGVRAVCRCWHLSGACGLASTPRGAPPGFAAAASIRWPCSVIGRFHFARGTLLQTGHQDQIGFIFSSKTFIILLNRI